MGLIYTATSKTTGKVYVGQTSKTLERRQTWHRYDIKRGESTKFYNAIRKYGWDDFDWIVIEQGIPLGLLGQAEAVTIERYNSIAYGYNTIPGGLVSPALSKEVAAKISAARMGTRPWNKGIPRTEEEKRNIRAGRLRAPRREGPSPLLGRKQTDEHRANISKALLGNQYTRGKQIHTAAEREKMRGRMLGNQHGAGNKGKPKTAETRRKMSEAAFQRHAKRRNAQ